MLIPAFLYGRFQEVKAACRRKVTQLKRGAEWSDLADEFIDTRDREGLLVLDGPSPLMGGASHFHVFAMAYAIDNAVPRRLPQSVFTTLFEPMIHTSWGFLVPTGQRAYSFFDAPGHQQRYLHLAIRWWPELEAEGARYSMGLPEPKHLWNMPTNIQHCMAREGLPKELFREPIPEGGIAELVGMTRAGVPPTRAQMH